MFPSNEAETIELYKVVQGLLGWEITYLQTDFPDAIITKNGKELAAEFEHRARNFKSHKHDPDGCDIIICWENNWEDAPLPVWDLKSRLEDNAEWIDAILAPYQTEIQRKEERIRHLENRVRNLQDELKKERASYDWMEEDFPVFLGNVYEEIMADLALVELEKRHELEEGALTSKYGSGDIPKRKRGKT